MKKGKLYAFLIVLLLAMLACGSNNTEVLATSEPVDKNTGELYVFFFIHEDH